MLTSRNVTITVVAIAALSVLGSVLSLFMPPDSDGLAADSYGTYSSGQKAIFDVLQELNTPIERSIAPPSADWPTGTTLVLWASQPNLIAVEPAHLHRVRDWVQSGGRLVISAPAASTLLSQVQSHSPTDKPPITIWEAVGLPNVKTETATIEEFPDAPPPINSFPTKSDVQKLFSLAPTRSTPVEIKVTGDLRAPLEGISKIAAPNGELEAILLDEESHTHTSGRVSFSIKGKSGKSEEFTLAASFPLGTGEILVIADRRLLENRWLAKEDNAAFGVRLLSSEGSRIVWDEFYHGLTLRGNPLALLKRPAYAAVAAASLLAILIWTWRRAIWLGPAQVAKAPSRRTLSEYVEAMGLLFARARDNKRFVLAEVRAGVLWTLRRRLHLSPGKEQLPLVVAALARKDQEAAVRLKAAMAALDQEITHSNTSIRSTTITTLQQVTDCLSKTSISAFATKLPK